MLAVDVVTSVTVNTLLYVQGNGLRFMRSASKVEWGTPVFFFLFAGYDAALYLVNNLV
jgi:hypothetical protein